MDATAGNSAPTPSALPRHPSEEQKRIVSTVLAGEANVVVNSVAGSGKTTVCMLVAKALFTPPVSVPVGDGNNILVMTYNKKLKFETRAKVITEGLHHVEVHSFHGMAVKYYNERAYQSEVLSEVVRRDSALIRRLPAYRLIVLDEVQDMSLLLFSFVAMLLRDYHKSYNKMPQLLFIGDANQCIYQFLDSDSRFLTMTPAVFNMVYSNCGLAHAQWRLLHLSTSYRVTTNMAIFINECMLGRAHILSHHSISPSHLPPPPSPSSNTVNAADNMSLAAGSTVGSSAVTDTQNHEHPVIYLIGSHHDAAQLLFREIVFLLRRNTSTRDSVESGSGPDQHQAQVYPRDIFVLGASLKSSSNTGIQLLSRLLGGKGIAVQDGAGGGEGIGRNGTESSVNRDAIAFCTFHQAKGLERRYVFVFGFDNSYFRCYDSNNDPHVCPCPLYVAATRATEFLCLVADESNKGSNSSGSVSYVTGSTSEGGHLPFLRRARLARLNNGPVHVYSVDSVRNYQPAGFIFGHNTRHSSCAATTTNLYKRRLGEDNTTTTTSCLPTASGLLPLSGSVKLPVDGFRVVNCDEVTKWLPDNSSMEMCGGLKKKIMTFCTKISASTATSSPLRMRLLGSGGGGSPGVGARSVAAEVANQTKGKITLAGFRSPGASKANSSSSSAVSSCREDIACLSLAAMLQTRAGCCGSKYCSLYYHLLEAYFDNCDRMDPRLKAAFRLITEPDGRSSAAAFVDLASLYYTAGGIVRGRKYFRLKPAPESESNARLNAVREGICRTTLHGPCEEALRDAKFEFLLNEDLVFSPNGGRPGSNFECGLKVIRVQATLDILTPEAAYKLRCSPLQGFDMSDFLQLALCAWLWRRTQLSRFGNREFYILNAATSELWRLDSDSETLDTMACRILRHHFRSQGVVSDEDFIGKVYDAVTGVQTEGEINPHRAVDHLGFISSEEMFFASLTGGQPETTSGTGPLTSDPQGQRKITSDIGCCSEGVCDTDILLRIDELTAKMRALSSSPSATLTATAELMKDRIPVDEESEASSSRRFSDCTKTESATAGASYDCTSAGVSIDTETAAGAVYSTVRTTYDTNTVINSETMTPALTFDPPPASVRLFHHNRYWSLQGFDLDTHELEIGQRLDRLTLDGSDDTSDTSRHENRTTLMGVKAAGPLDHRYHPLMPSKLQYEFEEDCDGGGLNSSSRN